MARTWLCNFKPKEKEKETKKMSKLVWKVGDQIVWDSPSFKGIIYTLTKRNLFDRDGGHISAENGFCLNADGVAEDPTINPLNLDHNWRRVIEGREYCCSCGGYDYDKAFHTLHHLDKPCSVCGMFPWEYNKQKEEEKETIMEEKAGQKIIINKPISGETVKAEGPCAGEFDRFVRRFGWSQTLSEDDVSWIIDNESVWDEWLQGREFYSVRKTVNFDGEWYDQGAQKERGKIYLNHHVVGDNLWIDLVDHNGEHLEPCNILSICYDEERKALRIGQQSGFEAPNGEIEHDHSGYANIILEDN